MPAGKIQSGSSVSPPPNSGGQKVDERKLKGVFQASGAVRGVSVHPAQSHIPSAGESRPQDRPLEQWDIDVQEVENRYINSAANFSGESYNESRRLDLKNAIKGQHTNLFEMLNQYNQRSAALLLEDRLTQKEVDSISRPLIRELMPIIEELRELDKSLDNSASKKARKDVKTALQAAKDCLKKAGPLLVNARVLLVESTKPLPEPAPEKKLVAQKKTKPVATVETKKKAETKPVAPPSRKTVEKKPDPPGVPQPSPELRLAETMVELKRPVNAERLQEIIETTVESLQTALQTFPVWIDESVKQGADPVQLAAYQEAFAQAFMKIQTKAHAPIGSDNVASLRDDLKDRIYICHEMIRKTRGASAPEPQATAGLTQVARGYFKPEEIGSAELRQRVMAYSKASSAADRKKALESVHQFLQQQQQRFDQLQSLFTIVHAKSNFQGEAVPEECTHAFSALSKLTSSVQQTSRPEPDAAWMEQVVQADKALATLEQFDQKVPGPVMRVLTTSPDSSGTPLINLMCRKLLNEETGPLTGRANLPKFGSVLRYLEQTQEAQINEENGYTAYQAFLDIIGEVFVTPTELRTLMNEARTLDEVYEVGLILREWRGRQDDLLQETTEDLKKITMDFQLEGVGEGHEAIELLIKRFPEGIKEHAGATAKERLLLLESALNQALQELVEERLGNQSFLDQFRTDKNLSERLQQEINTELGDVASVHLSPGSDAGDILRRVSVQLKNAEEDGRNFDRFINGSGSVCQSVRKKITEGQSKRLVAYDDTQKRWHWVPHPPLELESYRDDFVELFEEYHKAVGLAQQHQATLTRNVKAREQVEPQIAKIVKAIPAPEFLTRKIKQKPRKRSVEANLNQLNDTVANLKERPLGDIAEETNRTRDQVVAMVKAQQLSTQQAIEILEPLYELRALAESRTRSKAAQNQPVQASGAEEPESLKQILQKIKKKYQPPVFYKLFRPKRWRAYQFSLSLIKICKACPNGAMPNTQLLDRFANEIKLNKKADKDQLALANALKDYGDQLQKASRPVDPIQVHNAGS